MIVLNTEDTIRDLFERKGGLYASKASNFVAEFGNNWNLLFRPYVLVVADVELDHIEANVTMLTQ
jgi:hypothetical protein